MKPFVAYIKELLHEGEKIDKRRITKLAAEQGIVDPTELKESLELAVVLKCREVATGQGTNAEVFSRIERIYNNQVILSYRTSQSVMLQQYSTPAPIAYLAGLYVRNGRKNLSVFEPSAGNGLLTIAFHAEDVTVNEIDNLRHEHLSMQPFKAVLKQDATAPFSSFKQTFDGVVTNPPFGTMDTALVLGEFKINHLDHVMAIRALDTMKDTGRAAIIIGGHTHYDEKGRVQSGKNRIFLTYLYSHYNVEDILNVDGSLYSRQGTSFDVRLILISGRKAKPEGFPPLKNDDVNPITDFDGLYNRVSLHIKEQTVIKPMTFDEFYSKIRFYKSGSIPSYQLPDGTKGIGKKEDVEWFRRIYERNTNRARIAKAKANAVLLLQIQTE